MIGSLKGNVTYCSGNELVLEVGGVGYQLTVSSSVLATLDGRSQLKLVVYTDVRENAIQLLGFSSISEREVFLLLKKVKGVGARLALGIVSALGPQKLLSYIGHADVKNLQQVPGIGKKTAERVIVELREQVGALATELHVPLAAAVETIWEEEEGGQLAGIEGAIPRDAVLALQKLGFPIEQAVSAVKTTLEKESINNQAILSDAGELVRSALSNLEG